MGVEGRWWLLGAVGFVALAKGWRPLTKAGMKGYMAARDTVMRLSEDARTGLEELYQEARADFHRENLPATGDAEPAPARRRRRGTATAAQVQH